MGWEVHHSGAHDDQAEEEARDKGREADGFREDGAREGEARADDREVLHREGAQGRVLSLQTSGRSDSSCEELCFVDTLLSVLESCRALCAPAPVCGCAHTRRRASAAWGVCLGHGARRLFCWTTVRPP